MSGILPPGIRTYKPRRSRITAREVAALAESPWLVRAEPAEVRIDDLFGPSTPVILEIGFGTGDATAQMAADEPDVCVLAIDVHTPGVGNLLYLLDRHDLSNVRVFEGDALAVLVTGVPAGRLAGVRTFFPDPWPKARHHKRRLIQHRVIDAVQVRLVAGGFWHIATDWDDYAAAIQEEFSDRPGWIGGVIDRPEGRPLTHYERRAIREGRSITDLMYRTVSTDRSVPQSRHG